MVERNYLCDLLIGMFHFFPAGRKLFHYDGLEMSSFFFEQKTASESYSDLLADIPFYNTVCGKQSPKLEQAFHDLKFMGFLSSWGPQFNPYEFDGNRRTSEPAVKRMGRAEDLESLSKKFQERFALRR